MFPLMFSCFVLIFLEYRASLVVQMVENLPAVKETQVQSLGQEDSPEKKMATQYSWLENPMNREEPGRPQPWGHRKLDMTEHTW